MHYAGGPMWVMYMASQVPSKEQSYLEWRRRDDPRQDQPWQLVLVAAGNDAWTLLNAPEPLETRGPAHEPGVRNLGRDAWPDVPDADWLRKLATDLFSDHHRQHDTHNRLLQIAERLAQPPVPELVCIGQLIQLDDGVGTVFADWNEERFKLPPGTQLYARPVPTKEGGQ